MFSRIEKNLSTLGKSNANALSEAARKHRPEITSLLKDAIHSNIPEQGSNRSDSPPVIVDITSNEHAAISKRLADTESALKQRGKNKSGPSHCSPRNCNKP